MKIRMLASVAHKTEHLEEGEEVDLPENEARHLINLRRAEPLEKAEDEPKETRTTRVKPENRDPKPSGPK